MYYYFTGNYFYAIKINGLYFGVIGKEPKPISIENPSPFIELCPIDGGNNLNFIMEEKFFSSPPKPIKITDMKGGYLIDFCLQKSSLPFKVLLQKRFDNFEITLFNDDTEKVSIQTETDYFVENIDFVAPEIDSFSINNTEFVSIKDEKNGKKYLSLYKITGKTEKIFNGEISDCFFDNEIKISYTISDIAKHKIEITFNVKDNVVYESEKKVSGETDLDKLNEKIIPFAFFEDLCVGSDIIKYLSQDMQNNALYIKDYIKDFIGVMPPPLFRNINEVGLIRKKAENVFAVDYYIAEVENKKIINIKKSDD